MRYFLGFDAAKLKLDVSLIDESSTELWHDKVANDETVLTELLLTLAGEYVCMGNTLTSAVSCFDFSSIQTTGLFGSYGRCNTARTSYILRRYSSVT